VKKKLIHASKKIISVQKVENGYVRPVLERK
jgi:hypothetical protein